MNDGICTLISPTRAAIAYLRIKIERRWTRLRARTGRRVPEPWFMAASDDIDPWPSDEI